MTAAPSPQELEQAARLVRRHLGFATLREGQAETLVRVQRGEDVLAILPTGGGKSLCYQLPAMLGEGVTLVVSPLVALMKDQLDSLPPAMRAASTSLTGELSAKELRQTMEEIANGRYRLVYVAPERLRSSTFLQALRKAGLARLVVDEAHCVSVWGHDFRPDYLALPEVRRALGGPPLLAVTATAPPRVLADIQERLGPLEVVRASTDRPNLRLEAIVAKDADEKLQHLLQLCRETPGPGVVYCSSQVKTEQFAAALKAAGINAEAYHAGMGPARAAIQDRFMRDEIDVLVATVAFGMGVDKPNIRFIFHHDPSSSLENYYQEAGRAGRDGKPSRCVTLATSADAGTLKQRAKRDLPAPELIERAWKLVLVASDENGYALLEPEQVDSLQPGESVQPRVALSILQEAGAVHRLADVPRVFQVYGRQMPLFEAAQQLEVPPERVESELLSRGARYQALGRAMLFRVVGAPSRVEDVLERYARRAQERGEEMIAYVRDDGCRHDRLRRFFGEAPREGACGACDNCLGFSHELPEESGEDDDAAARAVLQALASMRGIGENNLVYMLRGDPLAPPWTDGRPGHGELGFRSASAIRKLIRRLEQEGHVARERLEHGGLTLKLSPKGAQALTDEGARVLPEQKRAPASPPRSGAKAATEELAEKDAPLFDALRDWRRERADEEGVPPYVVAHDATLREVATARPRTPDELRGVKGFGPKRVEKYGAGILAVVREHAPD